MYNSIMKTDPTSTHQWREQELAALKDQHRQAILDAGQQLCLEKGVADVDMKEIAALARVSRATLYRYYPSKRSMVYDILRRLVGQAAANYRAPDAPAGGTGFEKFSQFVTQLTATYARFPEVYRFMGMVDFYYGAQHDPQELIQLYQEIIGGLLADETPHLFLEEGQRDGSVRADLDPRLYASSVVAALVSLYEQIAATRDVTQAIYGLDSPDPLIETVSQALLRAIRP